MPRPSTPAWGARGDYDLQIKPKLAPIATFNQLMRNLGAPSRSDVVELAIDFARMKALSERKIPDRRRMRRALIDLSELLTRLERALDHFARSGNPPLPPIERSNQFDETGTWTVTALSEFPRQLRQLSRMLNTSGATRGSDLIDCIDKTVLLFGKLDDFSESRLLDGLWSSPGPLNLDPADHSPLGWFTEVARQLRLAADREAVVLGKKGRDANPWLHDAVKRAVEIYENHTNQRVTYTLEIDDYVARSEGAKFVVGLIKATQTSEAESAILSALLKHIRHRKTSE